MLSRLILAAALAVALASAPTSGDSQAWLQRAGIRVGLSELAHFTRDGRTLRGSVAGEILELALSGNAARGTLGGAAVELQFRREGEVSRAEGVYAGLPLSIRLSEHALSGHVATCAYELTRTSGDYEGSSSCTGAPAPTIVHVPAAMHAGELREQMLDLAFLLSSNAGAYEVTAPARR